MAQIYKNDYGTEIVVDMQTDITNATDYTFSVKKPDSTTVEWVPFIDGTKTFKYIIQEGDLDQSGVYTIQPSMTLQGWHGSCLECKFSVLEKI